MTSTCDISAPVNITNNTKICQSSCNYLQEYSNQKIIMQNADYNISILPDPSSEASKAIFNKEEYEVFQIFIFNKSIHQYNGKYAPGEIIIFHKNVSKPNDTLIVSIPITVSSVATSGSSLLSNLINQVNDHASRSTLSGSNSSGSEKLSPMFVPNIQLNLEKFISPSPFVFYKGALGGDNCKNPSNIIVYTPDHHSISLLKEDYSILEALLTSPPKNIFGINKQEIELYINEKGAGNEEEDIYIDCQPVNASDETVYVPNESGNIEFEKIQKEFKKLLKSPLGSGIIGIILLLALWYVIDAFFGIFRNINPAVFSPTLEQGISRTGDIAAA